MTSRITTCLTISCLSLLPAAPTLGLRNADDPPTTAEASAARLDAMTDQRLIYRGELHWRGVPFSGVADLEFRLFTTDTGDDQIGATVAAQQWRVNQGIVVVGLDFGLSEGLVDDGGAWLEIVINGTILSPRRFIPAGGWSMGGSVESAAEPGARRATMIDPAVIASLDADADDNAGGDGEGSSDDVPSDGRVEQLGGAGGDGLGGVRGSRDGARRPGKPKGPPNDPALPPGGGDGSNGGDDGDWGNGDDMGGADGSEGWQVNNGKVYTFDRVGINTSTVNANSHLHIRGGSLYSILIQFTPANRWAIYSTKGKVRLQDNYIDATGNVGLGTESPAAKLHVVGGVIMPAPSTGEVPGGIQFPPGSFGGGDSQRAGIIYQASGGSGSRLSIYNNATADDDIVFVQQGGERLSIADGRVGVGTSEPSNPLTVNGTVDVTGRLGVGTTSPSHPIHVVSTDARLIYAQATATSGLGFAIWGDSNSTSGTGVVGQANAPTGQTWGGQFSSSSVSGRGVQGTASSGTGVTYGVFGLNHSTAGVAVMGEAVAQTGATSGVAGVNHSATGRGVYGLASANTAFNYGVYGQSNSPTGAGVYGRGASTSGQNKGVWGFTQSPEGYAGYFTGPEGSSNYFSRKVGIGTVSPTDLLHVEGGNSNTSVKVRGGNGLLSSLRLFEANDFGFELEYDGGDDKLRLWSRKFNANEGVRMTWLKDGRVGIGTETPGFTLEVNGDAGKPGGGSWSTASDRRLKRDVQPLQGSLNALLALQGVTFEYLDPAAINELPGRRVGMIAQDVEQVFPDWVAAADDGYKRLTFRGFEALVVEALRELRAEKDAEIQQLRTEKDSEITGLYARLEQVERRLAELMSVRSNSSHTDSQAHNGTR